MGQQAEIALHGELRKVEKLFLICVASRNRVSHHVSILEYITM